MFILKPKKNSVPLTVIVTGDTWTAFGNPNSRQHHKLYNLLVAMGGVNESVTDGTYHFNVSYGRFFKIYAGLTKVED